MPRIALGGFQHETNTFAPRPTPYEEFEIPGGWPPMARGAALFPTIEATSTPIGGALAEAQAAGLQPVPLSWCMATPANRVTDDAFTRIRAMLLEELDAVLADGPLDGVYLDLHGAAVTDSHEDAEGALIAAVRERIGDLPLAVSIDLHANVTRAMVAGADLIDAYRHYPHTDMRATGARALRGLAARIAHGRPFARRFRQYDCLLAINWQCTLVAPGAEILAEIDRLAAAGDVTVSFAPGFPLADIAEAGPSLAVFGPDAARVEEVFSTLDSLIEARLPDYAGTLWSPEDAIAHAMAQPEDGKGPVVLADTQDNPGGGGEADTTGVLQALIDADAQGALVAIIKDPEAAAAAHAAGLGAELDLALGGGSGLPDIAPVRARFTVEALTDGFTIATGPMQKGNQLKFGPTAVLRTGGVRVIVTSRKAQVADLAVITHTGLDPAAQRVLVVKSSVHFRAAFAPIAREILSVLAPGPVTADLTALPFRHLRPGVALGPGGPLFTGPPSSGQAGQG